MVYHLDVGCGGYLNWEYKYKLDTLSVKKLMMMIKYI